VAVTFRVPAEAGATSAVILGEFTDWSAVPMTPNGDGGHEVTVELPAGTSYRFRYLLDGARWANDWEADDYVPNHYGSDASVVMVEVAGGASDAESGTDLGTDSGAPEPKAKSKSTAKSPAKSTGKSTGKSVAKATPKAKTKNATTSKPDDAPDDEPTAGRTPAKAARTSASSPRSATRLR
jgi:hypothetical protein